MSKKSEVTGHKNRPSPKCVSGAQSRGCFWAKIHENVEHHIFNKLSSLNLQVSLNAHANVLIWIFYFCFSGNWFRFKALRSELSRYKFHSLGSKLQKVPEFNLFIFQIRSSVQRCHIIYIAKHYNSFGREQKVHTKRYYVGQAFNIVLIFLAPLCFVIFKLLGIMVDFMIAVSTETNRVDVLENTQVSTKISENFSPLNFRKMLPQKLLWRLLNNR